MKYLLTLLCACAIFASCKDDSNDDPTEPATRRTVIVYMAADNNLSSYSYDDLQEMAEGSKYMPSDGKLIVFLDNANTNDKPRILQIKDEKIDTLRTYATDFYTSDPEKMGEVLAEIMDAYPAEDYALVLWGHATGWIIESDSIAWSTASAANAVTRATAARKRAYGVDNGEWMNIPTLAKVLGSLPSTFKYILADCCCFQNVETAYELRDVAEYIIGSPAETPAAGAPYDLIVQYLFDYTDNFHENIVDAYYSQTVNSCHEPLSVIKTSGLPALAEATAPMLAAVADNGGVGQYDEVAYYFSNSYSYPQYKLLLDMQDVFMKYVGEDTSLYADWKQALDDVVVYKKVACPWVTAGYVNFNRFELSDDNYGGISMFVPASYYPTSYLNGIKKMQWYHATGMAETFPF